MIIDEPDVKDVRNLQHINCPDMYISKARARACMLGELPPEHLYGDRPYKFAYYGGDIPARCIIGHVIYRGIAKPYRTTHAPPADLTAVPDPFLTPILERINRPLWYYKCCVYTIDELLARIPEGVHRHIVPAKSTTVGPVTINYPPDWYDTMVKFAEYQKMMTLYAKLSTA